MFEVDVNGLKQQYRSKPVMDVDITGSSGGDTTGSSGDASMKNLNVIFSGGSNSGMPDSCNVTYDELRGWIENGTPVFVVWNTTKYNTDGKVKMFEFFTGIEVGSSELYFYYQDYNLGKQQFKYKSDGSFEPVINT